MNLANEKWETVKGYPNYLISSESRVMNKTTGKLKAISMHKHGHRVVRLFNEGKHQLLKIYRLKAIAFIPNTLNKREVNHIDGNRLNEDLSNMEWATPKENMKHSYDTGLCNGYFKKGLEHQHAKLSKDDVYNIRDLRHKYNFRYKDIGSLYNITMDHAFRVANRKVHSHV
jgi:hypothetical protein